MAISIDDLFPSRFLKAADLKGQRRTLTMSKITSEEIGKEKKKEPVVYFQKCSKGLVLNKTNAKKIAEVTGSRTIDSWPGKAVVLYPKMIEFQGEYVNAIRVDSPTSNGTAVADETAPPPAFDDEGETSAFEADEDAALEAFVNDDVPNFPVPAPEADTKKASAKKGKRK
jgi:hypothetical protein